MKIKSNHPFTKAQLKSLNEELKKISPAEIVGMKAVHIPSVSKNITDIEIKHSTYDLNVFLSFTDLSDPEYPKSQLYQIDAKGLVTKDIRLKLSFNNYADRISYFANLEPVKFTY